jgi:hypothetical protein
MRTYRRRRQPRLLHWHPEWRRPPSNPVAHVCQHCQIPLTARSGAWWGVTRDGSRGGGVVGSRASYIARSDCMHVHDTDVDPAWAVYALLC